MTAFLIDLDGTLYKGRQRIEGAAAFLGMLDKKEIPYLLVTNNSTRSPVQVAGHLSDMGIRVQPERIYTTAMASVKYLQEHAPGSRVYCIGEEGLRLSLTEAGFELTEERPDYVVQGLDRHLTYDKLAVAVQSIQSGARYLLTNPDHLLPTDGGFIPGAGSISALICKASGAVPVVIGKPSPIIMNFALEKLGTPAQETWAVGDNVVTDIGGGIAAGCRTALVLTGLATAGNVKEQIAASGNEPDYISQDLLQLWEHIVSL
ncbi:TIGR01457 family HAD-type hydrolase [Paenibacillus lutrae]|uniref:Acid sugar phosphatase n=1 Tax=Paenibacillus lutrae TaxID=2078573 RepID=A0A7X3JXE9_9BACL|nr:TIGR01457 family HAD-type hydrolase [Paenibacillus lutrae]MVO98013.1 TIGR01457 family HAD-type hydrolase [Paenibacillus lutrae]